MPKRDDDCGNQAQGSNYRQREGRGPADLPLQDNQPEPQQRGHRPTTSEFGGKLQAPLPIKDALQTDGQKWMHHGVASPGVTSRRAVRPASQVSIKSTASVATMNQRQSFWLPSNSAI